MSLIVDAASLPTAKPKDGWALHSTTAAVHEMVIVLNPAAPRLSQSFAEPLKGFVLHLFAEHVRLVVERVSAVCAHARLVEGALDLVHRFFFPFVWEQGILA